MAKSFNGNPKPYIVSGDIIPLMQQWAKQRGFVLPSLEFFYQLRKEFTDYMKQIFAGFEFVPENELCKDLAALVQENGLSPVSLDRVYYPTEPALDITRLVTKNGEDEGLGKRADALPLICQFKKLIKVIKNREIVLVDDVIFTGAILEKVTYLLSKMGFHVSAIYAGIGIREGIERLNKAGYIVHCVRIYEKVIDEICERDFYPGVPLSGRLLIGDDNTGVPYILPFGKIGKWASIPTKWQKLLSKFCLQQTIKLFEAIESCSNRIIYCENLERKIINLPQDKTRYIDALKQIL